MNNDHARTEGIKPVRQEKLLVTVSEAAKLLSTGKNTVYELLHTGRLPFIRLGTTRGYRILLNDLLKWIEDERVN